MTETRKRVTAFEKQSIGRWPSKLCAKLRRFKKQGLLAQQVRRPFLIACSRQLVSSSVLAVRTYRSTEASLRPR